MKIRKDLAQKIKNHPGFLVFQARNVKTDAIEEKEKEKETKQGGAK